VTEAGDNMCTMKVVSWLVNTCTNTAVYSDWSR